MKIKVEEMTKVSGTVFSKSIEVDYEEKPFLFNDVKELFKAMQEEDTTPPVNIEMKRG